MPTPAPPLPAPDLEAILARTEPLWAEVADARILVTGGSGFFGTWLVESFAWIRRRLGLRTELHLTLRDPEAWRARFPHLAEAPGLVAMQGSLTDFRPPAGTFHGLIHAAVGTEPPIDHVRRSLEGALRLLDFAEGSGARRLLFTSSGAVYGPGARRGGPIPEDEERAAPTPEPGTAYGQAKRMVEHLFSAWAREHQAQAVLARGFAFVGPHLKLDANFAIGNFIRDALRGRPLVIQGDGTPRRSYLYAADLAAWLWTLYARAPGGVFHVGSDADLSILDLARTVEGTLAPGAGIQVARAPLPGALPDWYVPSIHNARTRLGLEPWTPLADAVRKTAAWHAASGARPS